MIRTVIFTATVTERDISESQSEDLELSNVLRDAAEEGR